MILEEEQISQILETMVYPKRVEQPLAPVKAPSLVQRVLDPEVNAHYQTVQKNRHVSEEEAELLNEIGFLIKHTAAVKLQTIAGIEALIAECSASPLVRAHASAIASEAIGLMEVAINGTMESYTAHVSGTMKNRRR
jgi:hypothetical protein